MFIDNFKKNNNTRGAAAILVTMLVLAFITTIAFVVGRLMIQEIKVSRDITNSFKAYELGIGGLERGSKNYKDAGSWPVVGLGPDNETEYQVDFQDGVIISEGKFNELERQLEVRRIFGGLFIQISTFGSNSCGVSNDSYAYCWGANSKGQIGNGNVTSSSVPALVLKGEAVADDHDGVYLKNIKSISVGDQFACAVSGDTTGNNVYCWGFNNSKQLGDPDLSGGDSSTPRRVHANVEVVGSDKNGNFLVNIEKLSAGGGHVCAVAKSENLYCWGSNSKGQLGVGDPGMPDSSEARRVRAGNAVPDDTNSGFITNIKSIQSAGGNEDGAFSCAVSFAGKLYCWGLNLHGSGSGNNHGLLGDGTTVSKFTPVRVLQADGAEPGDTDNGYLSNIKEVGGGVLHTCAISEDNTGNNIYCWGVNEGGQLGNGNTNPVTSLAPVRVLAGGALGGDKDGLEIYLKNMKVVAGGGSHTCVISNNTGNINSQYNVYCWGQNTSGQLGKGDATTSLSPVRVNKGSAKDGDYDDTYLVNLRTIYGGEGHTCAVSQNYFGYCWGSDSNGQLGNDLNNESQLEPVDVTGN